MAELAELNQKHMKYAQALYNDCMLCNDPDMKTEARVSMISSGIAVIRDILIQMEQSFAAK